MPRKGIIIGRRAVTLGTLAAAMMGALASPALAKGTLARIKDEGVIRAGIANVNPYGFVGADGQVSGQSPELLRAFFADMGVKVEPVVTEFGSLVGGLLAGRFDVVSTGMLIQPDRCSVVAFGNPEYRSDNAFAVRKGNPRNLNSYRGVAESDRALLGIIAGSGEVSLAGRAGIPQDRQVLFPDLTTAMAALQAGRVDAVVASTVTMTNAVRRAGTDAVEYVELSEQPVGENGVAATRFGAMAFRKEDDDLREAWNGWLAENLANGHVTEIIAPFGFGPETLPPVGLTAEHVCRGELPT